MGKRSEMIGRMGSTAGDETLGTLKYFTGPGSLGTKVS